MRVNKIVRDVKVFFKKNFVGIVGGAIIGFSLFKFLPDASVTSQVVQSQSFLDPVIGLGKTGLELAKSKIVFFFTILGGFLGGFAQDFARRMRWLK